MIKQRGDVDAINTRHQEVEGWTPSYSSEGYSVVCDWLERAWEESQPLIAGLSEADFGPSGETIMARSATVHAIANKRTPQEFAVIIRGKWQDNVPNILQTCMWLETARNELGKAGFVKLYRDELRWNKRMVSMLLKIATSENINDSELVQHARLPGCWATLYELSRLTDEQFQYGLETGIIHAGMERKDVKELKPPKPKRPEVVSSGAKTFADWRGEVLILVTAAYATLEETERPSLVSAIRGALEELENTHV